MEAPLWASIFVRAAATDLALLFSPEWNNLFLLSVFSENIGDVIIKKIKKERHR